MIWVSKKYLYIFMLIWVISFLCGCNKALRTEIVFEEPISPPQIEDPIVIGGKEPYVEFETIESNDYKVILGATTDFLSFGGNFDLWIDLDHPWKLLNIENRATLFIEYSDHTGKALIKYSDTISFESVAGTYRCRYKDVLSVKPLVEDFTALEGEFFLKVKLTIFDQVHDFSKHKFIQSGAY